MELTYHLVLPCVSLQPALCISSNTDYIDSLLTSVGRGALHSVLSWVTEKFFGKILLENCGSLKCWCPLQFPTGVSDLLARTPLVTNETGGAGWGQGSCWGLSDASPRCVIHLSLPLFVCTQQGKITPLQLLSCWVFIT